MAAPETRAAVAPNVGSLAGPGGGPLGYPVRVGLKVTDILQEEVDLVEKLFFLDRVEGRDLFELDVEGAGEEGLGVVLDQGAGLGIGARGDVDGLFELVDAGEC